VVVQAVTFNLECIFNAKMCVNSADRRILGVVGCLSGNVLAHI
jgi:hypothetical protein